MRTFTAAVLATCLLATAPMAAFAQSPSEILEKARAEAREKKEYEEILEDADPAVREAAFYAMLKLENPALQKMALDYALSGTDTNIRIMALKHFLFSQAQLTVRLKPDPNTPSKAQEAAKEYINNVGEIYTLTFISKDSENNTFTIRGNDSSSDYSGQLINLQVNALRNSTGSGFGRINLELNSENRLEGPLRLGSTPFIATIDLD